MNRYFYKLIAIFFFNFVFINSQPLSDLEIKYEQLEKEYMKENAAVDSLGVLILKRAALIDTEKKKNNPDEDKIIELMSGSATLSNNLEKHQRRVNTLEDNIEKIKQRLYKKYSVIIDSLRSQLIPGKENAAVNSQIYFYTERRLMVSPKIPMLSFNPQKVLKIDMKKIKDVSEKILFHEYLSSALSEVNTLLASVETESNEIGQIVDLEKRTKRFLEDTEVESGMIPRSISRETGGAPGDENTGLDFENVEPRSNESNVKAYNSLLNQLNTGNIPGPAFNWNRAMNEIEKNINMKDYQKLLKEVKLRLQELKLVLANKIDMQK
jgi:hypothetical protein